MDGIDGKDGELQDGSRFETFVGALNSFVKAKGTLAKLDTPIRIAIGHLRDASSVLSRSTQVDNAYLELLNRLSKSVDRERDRLRNKVRGISAELSAQVTGIGIKLSQLTGTPDQLESESMAAEAEISRLIESACGQLETAVQQAQSSLQEAVKDVLSSDLMLQFCARLDAGKVSVGGVQVKDGANRLNSQVKSLGNIGSKVGLEVGKLAQGSKAAQGLLSASGASGSVLHTGILSTGKLIGYSFKPWQAVNLAKTIGNVAKVLGPILSIVTVVMEVANAYEEAKNERKLSEGRTTVVGDFVKMADGLEHQFEAQLREVEKELHDRVEADINAARLKEETEIAASNDKVAVAVEIRNDLDHLLERIAQEFATQG
jgi:F0F1-type ATP synthase membrane subunit b/b'